MNKTLPPCDHDECGLTRCEREAKPPFAEAHGSADSCEYWKCPWCGCDRDWFDRTIHYHADGTEDGMKYRCEDCGRATDDLPPNAELSGGRRPDASPANSGTEGAPRRPLQ